MSGDEINLLPCPFCGGEAKSHGPYGDGLFSVECTRCPARVGGFDQCRQDAIDFWNQRHSQAENKPQDVAVKALQKISEANWVVDDDDFEIARGIAREALQTLAAQPANSGQPDHQTALERIALLDEADGHELTSDHARQAIAIATRTLGKHPSEIAAQSPANSGQRPGRLAEVEEQLHRMTLDRNRWPDNALEAAAVIAERYDGTGAPVAQDIRALKSASSGASSPPMVSELRQAVQDIIEANKEFRDGMPAEWEGDPLQDTIERAQALLSREEQQ